MAARLRVSERSAMRASAMPSVSKPERSSTNKAVRQQLKLESRKWILRKRLPHYHIEYHHQDEANGKANGAKVRVLTTGGFRYEFFYHHIEHGACCKS